MGSDFTRISSHLSYKRQRSLLTVFRSTYELCEDGVETFIMIISGQDT